MQPVKPDGSQLSDDCHVYVSRSSGKTVSDRLVKAAEDDKAVLVRFKVTLNRRRYEGDSWDLLEATEWQFYDWSTNDWQGKPTDPTAPTLKACRAVLVKAGKAAVPTMADSLASSDNEAMRKFILETIDEMDNKTVIAIRGQLRGTRRKLEKARGAALDRVNEALYQVDLICGARKIK